MLFLGPVSAFCSSFTWALGVSVYSKLGKVYAPYTINFLRAAVTTPLFFLLLCMQTGGLSQALSLLGSLDWSQYGWLTASTISSYAFGDVLFLASTRMLGVPAALSIASTYPLWSAFAGWYWRGQNLSPLNLVGLGLVVGGVVTVILATREDQEIHHEHKNFKLGCILAISTSLLWSLNTFAIAQAGPSAGEPLSLGTTIRMGAAFILAPSIGAVLYSFQRRFSKRKPPAFRLKFVRDDFRSSFWVLILEGFIGSLFFFYGIANSSLAVGSALAALAPAISVPIAWVMKTEEFSLKKTLGICVAIIGICLLVS